jgi:hypothetical protein
MALPTVYSIPLSDACRYTRRWREAGNSIKAFTIDKQELLDIIDELGLKHQKEIQQVRVYFGIKDDEKEALVLVGVDEFGNDITSFMKPGETTQKVEGEEESGTYDFTRPCPDTCDEGSPLNSD